MDPVSYKTAYPKPKELQRKWLLIDATNIPLGRLASRVAYYLRGKHKPYYTPHIQCGDYVIVVNAEKVRLTGKKWDKKIYRFYSGYPGGQKERTARMIYEKDPRKLIELAVKRMLPKNRLGRRMFRNLRIYVGDSHPHQGVEVEKITIKV